MASQKLHNGGGTGPFAFDFPSLEQSDIKVSIDNTEVTSGFSINNYDSATGGDITFTSNTASGTNNVRIYRQTEPETLAATFVAGSSISANDLNNCNKQTIFLADENRTSINNLALGNAASAVQISGSNIVDNSISSSKIVNLDVKTADIDNLAVTTGKLANNAVTNNKVDTNAAIQGTKISPDFGSQNIVTTGFLGSNDITITGSAPTVNLTDSGDNPDYSIKNVNGTLAITDNTNSAIKFQVDSSDGHVDLPSHVDIGGGADVTGNLTVTGDATFNNGLNTNGKDVYTNHGAFITLDHPNDPFKTDRSTSTNVDHIWHDDTDNAWNFCSDAGYKSAGNSKVKAGSFYGDGSNLTNLPTPAFEVARLSSNSTVSNSGWQTKLTRTITPSTSGTNLYVQMNGTARSAEDSDGSVKQIQVRLRRGSTVLVTYATTSNSSSTDLNLNFPYKDSYSHNGNQVTYTIQARFTGGGDDNPSLRAGTSLVIQEIL